MRKKQSTGKSKMGMGCNPHAPWNDKGIRRAARDLDINYSHLSRVLRGERSSIRLRRRYDQWRQENLGTVSR